MIRSRFGIALLSALGVVAATLAGGALHDTTAHPHIAARAQSNSLFDSFPNPVNGRAGAGTQLNTITVTDTDDPGSPPVFVKQVVPQLVDSTAPISDPFSIGPNEDCTGATISPGGYCTVEVLFTPNPKVENLAGDLALTLGDGSVHQTHNIFTSTDDTFQMPPTNPLQVNYGNVNVGTTTSALPVTVRPVPGESDMIMSVSTVSSPQLPGAVGDYHPVTDTCSNMTLDQVQQCAVGATSTPGAAGNRPAFLDLAYCDTQSFPTSDGNTSVRTPPPGVPPGQELTCGENDSGAIIAQHILVALTTNGVTPTSTTPPGQTFTPTLIALPNVAPAGRTTMITGTGFPDNSTVTLALVPLGTPAATNLSTIPGFVPVTTNGIGGFSNQVMLIMPHTAPGQYEIMGTAGTANATVAFLVAPGIQEPPKFVNRH